ncbi:MAG TPA: TolC family protein [Opitutaceae bacterium]|nr:TolC family protein [Opitutaceae bacterium]
MKFRLLFFCMISASAARADDKLTLARVLKDVGEQHPQVRAAQALAAADRERIPQASAWDDPTVGIEHMRRDNLRILRADETEFSVSQKLPVTSQRRQRVALAKAEAAVADSRVSAQVTPLVIQATDAFYRLVRARELLELTRSNDEILARALSAVQARLASGATDVTSVLLAETERARLQEPVIALEREIAEATTMLNTLRNLPPESAIGALDASVGPAAGNIGTFESLRDRALAYRPELRAADAQVTAADRATDVARAWLPDPEVTVRARHIRGTNSPISEYDTGLAISLPWINRGKYQASVREAQRRRDAAELDVALLRSRTVAELRDAWTRHESAMRSVTLYHDRLLPLAERSLGAASTGLDSGKSGILELVSAQKNLREVRNALADAQSERARALAVIGAMTGQNFFTLP